MKSKKFIFLGLGVVVLLALLVWGISLLWPSKQEISTKDPIEIVLDFYDPWLAASQATNTDPYKLDLHKEPILSKELQKRIADAENISEGELDPVLCQEEPPAQISARIVSEYEKEVEVLVVSTDRELTAQAVITLFRHNNGWYIGDITCTPGEFGPDREFSFEMEGHLLKSVPAPFDSKNWHLVFEQGGVPGHVVPLLFDGGSECQTAAGNVYMCNPDEFTEPSKAFIQGQMTEFGVNVEHIKLLE